MSTKWILFRQLFDCKSYTYTYLLGDLSTRQALLIDPVAEHVERDLKLISELELELKLVLDTHVHADHVTAAGELRTRTGAKTGISEAAQVTCADLQLVQDEEIKMGSLTVKCLFTPGHTAGCMSYLIADRVFTGDSLLVRTNGRTDFQGGSPERLYQSIHSELYTLPGKTRVYPAHDYNGFNLSTIEEEMKFNARIPAGRTQEEFSALMRALKLSDPKLMAVALPANQKCGTAVA